MTPAMDPPRVAAFVQARMASTRLPGKILAEIGGRPMLMRVVGRARRAATVDAVVVATTTSPEDDRVEDLCVTEGVACFRGHPQDVLDRLYHACLAIRPEVVVRLTADCPLLDPAVVDRTVTAFLRASPPVDFAANRFPGDRTFPIGLDTEVCRPAALERAWREADLPHQREHVMPYLYETPGRFRVLHVRADRDRGELRWTVDTQEDLEFVRAVYARFSPREDFGWEEILGLLDREPDLASINAGVMHKSYRDAE